MSKLTAAYIAGFVDGEGHISLKPGTHKNNKVYYTPIVKIANTNREIIEWLKASYGGWIYTKYYKDKQHKDCYCWQLTGPALEGFLLKIQPYLKIKKEQCKLVFEKIKNQKKLNLPHKNLSYQKDNRKLKADENRKYQEEVRIKNEALYIKLRQLNKRGKELQPERLSEIPSSNEEAIV